MATETSGSKKFDVLRFCELLKQGDDENAIMYFCDMRGYESMMWLVSRTFGLSSYNKKIYEDIYSEIKTVILTKWIQTIDRTKNVNQMSHFLLYYALDAYKSVVSNTISDWTRLPVGLIFQKKNATALWNFKETAIDEFTEVEDPGDIVDEVTNAMLAEKIMYIAENIKYKNERDKKIVILYIKNILEGGDMTLKLIWWLFDLRGESVRVIAKKYFKEIKNEFVQQMNNII